MGGTDLTGQIPVLSHSTDKERGPRRDLLMEFRSLLLEILIPHPLLSSHVLKDENTKISGYETHPFSFQAFHSPLNLLTKGHFVHLCTQKA